MQKRKKPFKASVKTGIGKKHLNDSVGSHGVVVK